MVLVNLIRKILYPISLLYGLIMSIRNKAFDRGILSSRSFDLPVIAVGNLNVGGTGKSPFIEYLIRLCQGSCQTAVVSRGYGRKTKGFFLATPDCSARELGDEPFQFYRKFKGLEVAVDENRVRAIEKLQTMKPEVDLILMDDAFQHRYVKAGMYILLTAFDNLYSDDFLLPTGNLREPRKGADRADLIVVSKCPEDLSERKRLDIIDRIAPKRDQEVFFSAIAYDEQIYADDHAIPLHELGGFKILLVTGIANSKPLVEFLEKNKFDIQHIEFSDHQFIGDQQQRRITSVFNAISGEKKLILTTEKDFVRSFLGIRLPVYYLPIKMVILEREKKFNEIIENYVRKN